MKNSALTILALVVFARWSGAGPTAFVPTEARGVPAWSAPLQLYFEQTPQLSRAAGLGPEFYAPIVSALNVQSVAGAELTPQAFAAMNGFERELLMRKVLPEARRDLELRALDLISEADHLKDYPEALGATLAIMAEHGRVMKQWGADQMRERLDRVYWAMKDRLVAMEADKIREALGLDTVDDRARQDASAVVQAAARDKFIGIIPGRRSVSDDPEVQSARLRLERRAAELSSLYDVPAPARNEAPAIKTARALAARLDGIAAADTLKEAGDEIEYAQITSAEIARKAGALDDETAQRIVMKALITYAHAHASVPFFLADAIVELAQRSRHDSVRNMAVKGLLDASFTDEAWNKTAHYLDKKPEPDARAQDWRETALIGLAYRTSDRATRARVAARLLADIKHDQFASVPQSTVEKRSERLAAAQALLKEGGVRAEDVPSPRPAALATPAAARPAFFRDFARQWRSNFKEHPVAAAIGVLTLIGAFAAIAAAFTPISFLPAAGAFFAATMAYYTVRDGLKFHAPALADGLLAGSAAVMALLRVAAHGPLGGWGGPVLIAAGWASFFLAGRAVVRRSSGSAYASAVIQALVAVSALMTLIGGR